MRAGTLSAAVGPTGACMPVVLALHGVHVSLGPAAQVEALRDIRLQIHAGDSVALVGPNGCGKSTLLRTLHGLLPIATGARAVPQVSRIAMLFQRPHMLRMSVRRNLQLGLWLSGVPWGQTRERAQQALQRVDLAHLADRNGRALSGGQQQRVALARAWAPAPEILFLDEPTASLDPGAARAVEEIVLAMAQEGTRIVMTTHNLGQARRIADEIVFVDRGRIAETAPADRFFTAPATPAAATFLEGELPW